MNYDIRIDLFRTKHYYVDKVLHREDGPAIEFANGEKWWYKNGKLHRDDGPAIEDPAGTKCWYKNGKCHREEGPAVEVYNGSKYWHFNGTLYGTNNDFTIKSWKAFVKTLIFS